MKCLVVDESATMRRILRNAARESGCDEVIEAVDGVDALERWDAECKLVATGWLTSAMSGPEMVRRLRARAEAVGLRVIMVTSRDRAAQVEEAKEAGVDGYLVKPVTPSELVRRLQELRPAAGTVPETGGVDEEHAPADSDQANATSLDRAA